MTDVVIEKKPSSSKSRTYDKVHVAPRVADDNHEKEYEVKECTVENNSFLEECHEKQEVLGPKSTNFGEGTNEREDQKSENDPKKFSTPNTKPVTYGNARGNFTVPHPFALATEKRGSCTTRHVGAESPIGLTSLNANNENSPSKNLQVTLLPENVTCG